MKWNGCNQISKSVKKSWTKIGPWALEDKDYTEIKNSSGEVVFKYKSRINEIELTYKNEDGKKSKKTIKENIDYYLENAKIIREGLENFTAKKRHFLNFLPQKRKLKKKNIITSLPCWNARNTNQISKVRFVRNSTIPNWILKILPNSLLR